MSCMSSLRILCGRVPSLSAVIQLNMSVAASRIPTASWLTRTAPLSCSAALSRERHVVGKSKGLSPSKLRGDVIDESDNQTANVDALSKAARSGTTADPIEEEQDEENVSAQRQEQDDFQAIPDADVLDRLFDGIKYRDLPYVHIRCHKNNTRLYAFDAEGRNVDYAAPIMFGFANAAKRTNVAAQVTGVSMGQRLRNRNMRTVRVRVEGFNNGRIAAVKGLVQAGLKVVSVTDQTHVDWHWARRAKKRKRQN